MVPLSMLKVSSVAMGIIFDPGRILVYPVFVLRQPYDTSFYYLSITYYNVSSGK